MDKTLVGHQFDIIIFWAPIRYLKL